MRRHLTPQEIRDPLLAEWGDWLDHDGQGIPAHLMGRDVLVSGLLLPDRPAGTPYVIGLNPAYAASAAAAVWTWCNENEGDCVLAYRVRRQDRLRFDADTLHALDRARGFMGLNGSRPLLIGLDGAEA